jgi:CDP-diacylglycerol--serine O-phosphatidyltransferase
MQTMETDKEAEKISKKEKRKLLLVRGPRYVREKFHGRVFLVPSSVTVVGIFCGFLGIISAIRGNFEYAARCIGLSIILDGIDGRVARRLNATSAFGREFDSLSDAIAFGVAPAVLFYCWAFSETADEFGVLAGFIYVVCAAARLARFNVATSDDPRSHFVGLPSPGAAAAVSALVYAFPTPIENLWLVGFLFCYMILVGGLMVTTIPFFSVKKIKFTREKQKLYLIALALFVAIAWKYNRMVILLISTAYAMSGLVQYARRNSLGIRSQEKNARPAHS